VPALVLGLGPIGLRIARSLAALDGWMQAHAISPVWRHARADAASADAVVAEAVAGQGA
jgi:hypothetical protein